MISIIPVLSVRRWVRTIIDGAPAPMSVQLRFTSPWEAREFSAYLWGHKGSETRIIEEGCSLIVEKGCKHFSIPEGIICTAASPLCLPSVSETERLLLSGTSIIILIGGYGLESLPHEDWTWLVAYDECRLIKMGVKDSPCGMCDVCTNDVLLEPAGLDVIKNIMLAFSNRFTRGELKNFLYSCFPAEGIIVPPAGVLSDWASGEVEELIFSLEKLRYLKPYRGLSFLGKIGHLLGGASLLSFDFDKKSFMDRYREFIDVWQMQS
ncbi:hypothetical protein WKV44_06930 [Spirochaetia bacterium 38H-sp]|uniref:Uncharacterized protein n=1 Tax=Rarispira pelagica TaxID=3141764 RepID=A0ABU9UC84_9SPIR